MYVGEMVEKERVEHLQELLLPSKWQQSSPHFKVKKNTAGRLLPLLTFTVELPHFVHSLFIEHLRDPVLIFSLFNFYSPAIQKI